VLSYQDNLSLQSHDECPRYNTEVTQGQIHVSSGLILSPTKLVNSRLLASEKDNHIILYDFLVET
jgi:hypothetical protein